MNWWGPSTAHHDHHALTLGSRCAVWSMTTPYIYIYNIHVTIDTSYWPYIHQTEINPLFRRNIQRMTVLCKVQLHGPLGLGAVRLHSSCFGELGYDDCFSCCYGIGQMHKACILECLISSSGTRTGLGLQTPVGDGASLIIPLCMCRFRRFLWLVFE